MENVKKPSRDYYGLKRLIEIGSIACPLVVVFAVTLSPLIAESVSLLVSHGNNLIAYKKAALTFGIGGLAVALLSFVFVGIQAYYYFTRTRKGRWTLYAFGCVLLALIAAAVIINSCMLGDSGVVDAAALRCYITFLQSFIAISIFIIFNFVFMFTWTRHLKNAGVPRKQDKMINVDVEE